MCTHYTLYITHAVDQHSWLARVLTACLISRGLVKLLLYLFFSLSLVSVYLTLFILTLNYYYLFDYYSGLDDFLSINARDKDAIAIRESTALIKKK